MYAPLLLVASQSSITVIATVVAIIVAAVDVATIIFCSGKAIQRRKSANIRNSQHTNSHTCTHIQTHFNNTCDRVATLYVFINVLSYFAVAVAVNLRVFC